MDVPLSPPSPTVPVLVLSPFVSTSSRAVQIREAVVDRQHVAHLPLVRKRRANVGFLANANGVENLASRETPPSGELLK